MANGWWTKTTGCPVTVYVKRIKKTRRCSQPLVEGSKFCEFHESERVRLTPKP